MRDSLGFIHYAPYTSAARLVSTVLWLALLIGTLALLASHRSAWESLLHPSQASELTPGTYSELGGPTYDAAETARATETFHAQEIIPDDPAFPEHFAGQEVPAH